MQNLNFPRKPGKSGVWGAGLQAGERVSEGASPGHLRLWRSEIRMRWSHDFSSRSEERAPMPGRRAGGVPREKSRAPPSELAHVAQCRGA